MTVNVVVASEAASESSVAGPTRAAAEGYHGSGPGLRATDYLRHPVEQSEKKKSIL